ncbi:hypothetical protein [Klebsiella pneumoniae]|uniref:hypothetical protein n=1 Tax=Klebsiella pneumoniae TaxID=573 RepID=UPI003C75E195
MTDITELALLVSKAKASVFTLEYISQFEPADIDSDDVDLRFEVDGRDTGTNVSIVDECGQAAKVIGTLVEALEKAQQRIAELENNEIQEEGNQFLVVRHPGKVPVIKHPVGELEDYLRQIFKADPLATIDIVTHRYYGVGGQFVKDADEYLHEMSVKVEAE